MFKQLLTIACVALALSCNKSDKIQASTSIDLGEAHNQGLDFVYWKLQRIVQQENRPVYHNDIANFSERFVREKLGYQGEIAPAEQQMEFSAFQKEYLSALKSVHAKVPAGSSNAYLQTEADWLKLAKTSQDSAVIIASARVAKASSEYWEEAAPRWAKLRDRIKQLGGIRTQHNQQQQDSHQDEGSTVKAMVWGDVVGAATGALRGFFLGWRLGAAASIVAPGAGTVVVGSTVVLYNTVVGAITASAEEGVRDNIGNPFD